MAKRGYIESFLRNLTFEIMENEKFKIMNLIEQSQSRNQMKTNAVLKKDDKI